jgi:glucosamine--fructose-6-phosphate aminotransferase (isomerizing)
LDILKEVKQMYVTYSEIKDQYNSLSKTYEYLAGRREQIVTVYKEHSPKSLNYMGCGSSYYLCQSGELSAKIRLGIAASSLAAGDVMLNYPSYGKVLNGSMVVVLSRSGSTSEIIKALQQAKSVYQPLPVLGIACVAGSELSAIADLTLELPWAFDQSVCQTRTVVNLYVANLLVLAYLSGEQKLVEDIATVIRIGNNFMDAYERELEIIAKEPWEDVVVLADGEIQGLADEGALAFTEIARVPGSYRHLLDVRHGPMVLIDKNSLVVVCLNSKGIDYQLALINDLLKKGATVITYSDLPINPIPGVRLQATSGVSLDHAVRGIPFIFIAQALAYFKAINKGVNPDQPEGLDAWIKL